MRSLRALRTPRCGTSTDGNTELLVRIGDIGEQFADEIRGPKTRGLAPGLG